MNKEYVFIGGRAQGKTRDLIQNLISENKQLKEKLEMQKDRNKLLCKSIMCDDCNCSVCEAHKQQIRLEQQLKQRDEVIDEVNKLLEYYYIGNLKFNSESQKAFKKLLEILQKYKGDNNG